MYYIAFMGVENENPFDTLFKSGVPERQNDAISRREMLQAMIACGAATALSADALAQQPGRQQRGGLPQNRNQRQFGQPQGTPSPNTNQGFSTLQPPPSTCLSKMNSVPVFNIPSRIRLRKLAEEEFPASPRSWVR